MKKCFAMLASVLLCMGLCACGGNEAAPEEAVDGSFLSAQHLENVCQTLEYQEVTIEDYAADNRDAKNGYYVTCKSMDEIRELGEYYNMESSTLPLDDYIFSDNEDYNGDLSEMTFFSLYDHEVGEFGTRFSVVALTFDSPDCAKEMYNSHKSVLTTYVKIGSGDGKDVYVLSDDTLDVKNIGKALNGGISNRTAQFIAGNCLFLVEVNGDIEYYKEICDTFCKEIGVTSPYDMTMLTWEEYEASRE